jgi:hypothetical protein
LVVLVVLVILVVAGLLLCKSLITTSTNTTFSTNAANSNQLTKPSYPDVLQTAIGGKIFFHLVFYSAKN